MYSQHAHPMFGGVLGDAARRGGGIGLAPLSEGYTAFVPNPAQWPGMTAVQQTAFPMGAMPNPMQPAPQPGPLMFNPRPAPAPQPRPIPFNPAQWPGMTAVQQTAMPGGAIVAGEAAVQQRAFNPSATVRYMGPGGAVRRVKRHRVYRTPSGAMTSNPYVANVTTQYVTKWLPASWSNQRPGPAHVAWIQLSRGNPNVGLMHAPKLQARPVQVLQVENDAWGKPRALVRHRMGSVKQNPARQVVSTRQRRKRRRARVSIAPAVTQTRRTAMRGLATGTTQRGGIKDWWCSRFPNTCKEIATPCGPGYEPDPSKPGGCLPSGSGPTSPNPRMLARAVKARKNPIPGTEMSGYQRAYNPTVGAHRYQANRGVRDRVGRILRAIGRGDASVSLGRGGISINEKAA